MRKEFVRPNLDEVTKQEPYYTYYYQRNGKIADYLANFLGATLVKPDYSPGETYEVLATTITKETADQLNISSPEDFYGGVVDHLQHVEKSALHPCVDKAPDHYSAAFAHNIRDAVLPGFSFFNQNGAEKAADELGKQFDQLRLKLPLQSDGHGQYIVTSSEEVVRLIKQIDKQTMQNYGAVLEPNLLDTQTISYGELSALGVSFVARQLNDIGEDGRDRYIGAEVEVFKQTLVQFVNKSCLNPAQVQMAQKAAQIHQAYSVLNPMFTRVSYDLLIGRDKHGKVYCGVTDVTARVGGTCPALMCVGDVFARDAEVSTGKGSVFLEYHPESGTSKHEQVFIDHSTLRISATGYGRAYKSNI